MSTEEDMSNNIMDNISKFTNFVTSTIGRSPPPEQGGFDKPLTSSEIGTGLIKDIEALGLQESIEDIRFATKLIALGSKPWDDSQFQLEKLIQIMSKLPPGSRLLMEMEKVLLTRLWSDITKPPNMLAGDFYRAADASNYSRLYPGMGKSNSRYAKSVRIERPLPLNLPDPGLLFDTLMVRKKFKPHPSSVSSMMFHLATVITHDLFDSSPTEPYVNQTSSYLDLTPLYGRNLEQQMSVRTGSQGLLKPDTFADRRILLQPPGVGCLLVLFSRNHNYIAKRILQINEHNRFSVKDPNDEQELKKQDEDLFQTARLINTGFYFGTIIHDYLHIILGLINTDSHWFLDPTKIFPKDTMSNPIPTGVGNQVSLEFNYIYRWHPIISEADAKWVDDRFKMILGDHYPGPGKEELTVPVFQKLMKEWREKLPDEPEKRNFGGLERIKEGELKGTFRDTDLVRELAKSVDQVAGSFGANGIPTFRVIEVLGISSARELGVCSLNELRRFLNLEPYKSFEDMNPDKEVADKLRLHYGHIDNVEMYPGVLVEKAKPSFVGAGIAINFTISRAILTDAVNLVRNDRFLTDDFNSHNLTNWGFGEVQSDPTVADGSILYKVILRNTTGCYKPNSVYAMFPFTIPSQTKEILKKRGIVDQYDFSTPAIKEEQQQRVRPILSYRACREILSDKDTFHVTYDESMKLIMGGIGFYLGYDDKTTHDRDKSRMTKTVYTENQEKFLSHIKQFFLKTTQELIDKNKRTFDDKTYYIDVIRDVCNLAPAHYVSEVFGLPLKTPENPNGAYTDHEAYLQLTIIFFFIFINIDPGSSFKLTQTAKQVSDKLHNVMQKVIDTVCGNTSLIQRAAESLTGGADIKVTPHARQMIQGLMSQYNNDSNKVVWNILGSMDVSFMGKATSTVVDFYLRPENKSHLEEIRKLADKTDEESEKLVLGYVLDALRFTSPAPGLLRRPAKDVKIDDGSNGTINLKPNEIAYLSFESAHMDPSAFPEPEKINPRRPIDSYLFFGQDFHRCFGRPINLVALPSIVKTILKIKGLKRAPNRSGQLHRAGRLFITPNGTFFPFPTDMTLQFTERI